MPLFVAVDCAMLIVNEAMVVDAILLFLRAWMAMMERGRCDRVANDENDDEEGAGEKAATDTTPMRQVVAMTVVAYAAAVMVLLLVVDD